MAALTADREYAVSGRTEILHAKLTESDSYFKGAMVQFDKTTGLAKVAVDVSLEGVIGVLKAGQVVGAGVNPDCEIETGKIWIPHSGAAVTDVDTFVHAADDGDILLMSAQVGDPCGRVLDWKTGFLLVDFRQRLPKTALA